MTLDRLEHVMLGSELESELAMKGLWFPKLLLGFRSGSRGHGSQCISTPAFIVG